MPQLLHAHSLCSMEAEGRLSKHLLKADWFGTMGQQRACYRWEFVAVEQTGPESLRRRQDLEDQSLGGTEEHEDRKW